MQIPLQVAFHGIDKSDAVEERIRERAEKLEHYFDRITSCRVVVEAHHRSHSNMNVNDTPFHVSIQVSVPGEDLVVKRDPKDTKIHEDILAAVRDSFDTMERRLKSYVDRRFREGRHQGDNG